MTQLKVDLLLHIFLFENPFKILHSLSWILCNSTKPQPWPSPISFTLTQKEKAEECNKYRYVEVYVFQDTTQCWTVDPPPGLQPILLNFYHSRALVSSQIGYIREGEHIAGCMRGLQVFQLWLFLAQCSQPTSLLLKWLQLNLGELQFYFWHSEWLRTSLNDWFIYLLKFIDSSFQ